MYKRQLDAGTIYGLKPGVKNERSVGFTATYEDMDACFRPSCAALQRCRLQTSTCSIYRAGALMADGADDVSIQCQNLVHVSAVPHNARVAANSLVPIQSTLVRYRALRGPSFAP